MGDCPIGTTERQVARGPKECPKKEVRRIIDILRARSGVILDGSRREPAQPIEMARAVGSSFVTLVLPKREEHSVDQLLEITRAGKGRVVLELYNSTPRQRARYVGLFQESGLRGL
jgi:hypothetical protein